METKGGDSVALDEAAEIFCDVGVRRIFQGLVYAGLAKQNFGCIVSVCGCEVQEAGALDIGVVGEGHGSASEGGGVMFWENGCGNGGELNLVQHGESMVVGEAAGMELPMYEAVFCSEDENGVAEGGVRAAAPDYRPLNQLHVWETGRCAGLEEGDYIWSSTEARDVSRIHLLCTRQKLCPEYLYCTCTCMCPTYYSTCFYRHSWQALASPSGSSC